MTPTDIEQVRHLAKDIRSLCKDPLSTSIDRQDADWLTEFAKRMTTDRKKLVSALRTALSNFSGADDSEIREALKSLGATP